MRVRPSSLKTVPWLLVLEAVRAGHEHYARLTPAERRRLVDLLVQSKGRPSTLRTRDKLELRRIVRKLDLKGLGKDLVPLGVKHRRGRGRR